MGLEEPFRAWGGCRVDRVLSQLRTCAVPAISREVFADEMKLEEVCDSIPMRSATQARCITQLLEGGSFGRYSVDHAYVHMYMIVHSQ